MPLAPHALAVFVPIAPALLLALPLAAPRLLIGPRLRGEPRLRVPVAPGLGFEFLAGNLVLAAFPALFAVPRGVVVSVAAVRVLVGEDLEGKSICEAILCLWRRGVKLPRVR